MSAQVWSDPLAVLNERLQRLPQPQTSISCTFDLETGWKCEYGVTLASGGRYEGTGSAPLKQDAKRAAVKELLTVLPLPAVSTTDNTSMIIALTQVDRTLRLEGRSSSIELLATVWSFKLHVIGGVYKEFGPIIGPRDQAVSYVLEDACLDFGYLGTRRAERVDPDPVEMEEKEKKEKEKKVKDLARGNSSYTTDILDETRAFFAGPSNNSPIAIRRSGGELRYSDVKSLADQIRFIREQTTSVEAHVVSEGSTINRLWVYRVYVNGETLPIATSSPSPYRRAKRDAMKTAFQALGRLGKRRKDVADIGSDKRRKVEDTDPKV